MEYIKILFSVGVLLIFLCVRIWESESFGMFIGLSTATLAGIAIMYNLFGEKIATINIGIFTISFRVGKNLQLADKKTPSTEKKKG